MTSFIDYKPEPGSLAERVLGILARNPGEEYTSSDLALKFQVAAKQFNSLLETPLGHGLLTFEKEPGDVQKMWREGRNFRAWLRGHAGTADAASAPAAKAAKASASGRSHVPLDPMAVVVRSGVPVPPISASRGISSPYLVLWNRLKAGDCAELPDKRAHSFVSFLKKNKHPHTVRRIGVGVMGVWRGQ